MIDAGKARAAQQAIETRVTQRGEILEKIRGLSGLTYQQHLAKLKSYRAQLESIDAEIRKLLGI